MFPYYLFNRLSFLALFASCTIYIFGAKFINLVQICLKNSHYNFFGAACIYRYFYVPVQFATFLSGCILVTFWFLVSFFAIIIWFWLPFQYTIITGLFDSLHQFQLGCILKKRVQIFPRFSTKFYFRLLSLHTIIKSLFDVLHSFIKGCNFKKVGAFGYFFRNFPQTFIFGCYL